MVDYEKLPDVAGLDGLLSIFPRYNPFSALDLDRLWQLHKEGLSTTELKWFEPTSPAWQSTSKEILNTPWAWGRGAAFVNWPYRTI